MIGRVIERDPVLAHQVGLGAQRLPEGQQAGLLAKGAGSQQLERQRLTLQNVRP